MECMLPFVRTDGVARVSTVRLPDSSPRDLLNRWLQTLGDMARWNSQRCSRIRNVFCSVSLFKLLFLSGSFIIPCYFFRWINCCCELTTKARTRWWKTDGRTNWTELNWTDPLLPDVTVVAESTNSRKGVIIPDFGKISRQENSHQGLMSGKNETINQSQEDNKF